MESQFGPPLSNYYHYIFENAFNFLLDQIIAGPMQGVRCQYKRSTFKYQSGMGSFLDPWPINSFGSCLYGLLRWFIWIKKPTYVLIKKM